MQLAIIFVVLWVALSVGKKTTTTVKISTLNKLTRQVKRAKHIVKKLSVTKRFLYRPPLVVFSKTTRYNVCARPYTQEEATKRDELKALIDKSKDRYINNHQQCPGRSKCSFVLKYIFLHLICVILIYNTIFLYIQQMERNENCKRCKTNLLTFMAHRLFLCFVLKRETCKAIHWICVKNVHIQSFFHHREFLPLFLLLFSRWREEMDKGKEGMEGQKLLFVLCLIFRVLFS